MGILFTMHEMSPSLGAGFTLAELFLAGLVVSTTFCKDIWGAQGPSVLDLVLNAVPCFGFGDVKIIRLSQEMYLGFCSLGFGAFDSSGFVQGFLAWISWGTRWCYWASPLFVFEELQERYYPGSAQEVHGFWLLCLSPVCQTLPPVVGNVYLFYVCTAFSWGPVLGVPLVVCVHVGLSSPCLFSGSLSVCGGFCHLVLEGGCSLAGALCHGMCQGQPSAKEVWGKPVAEASWLHQREGSTSAGEEWQARARWGRSAW